jgi:protein O-mannosyl-transferase
MPHAVQYKPAVRHPLFRHLVVPISLFASALGAHANTFVGNFQFDDFSAVLENPHLERWQTFIGHLDHMVRPVLYATFLMDRALYGENPMGYHLLNLFLHLGSGVFVYRILARAVTQDALRLPFWASLLFLIHPIQTEAVTYISGRATGLMAFFYLLALFLYIKASEVQDAPKAYRLYLSGAIASFAMSLGSKETAMTFPLMLLLWDTVIGRLSRRSLRAAILSRHLPFWIVLLLAGAWALSHPRYSFLAQVSIHLRPVWENFLSEVHAVAYALMLYFHPWKQNFDHDLPVFHSLIQWPLLFDLSILVGMAVTALFTLRRLPLLSFGIIWFFIQLLPTSLIPRADLFSERNLYLASIGLVLATVVLASCLMQWVTTALPNARAVQFGGYSVVLLVVFLLGFLTHQRNLVYRDQVSFWSDTVRKSPNKARAHNNLGHAHALEGEWDEAIEEFRAAARLDPDNALAQKNLRDAYLHRVGRL